MLNKKLIIIAIVIIISSFIVFFFKYRLMPKPTTSSGLVISKNAIYVAGQIPGSSVLVAMVRLEKPGFVVIHEDLNGQPGKILGQSNLIEVGEKENLPVIELSRATQDGETIYAMLHFDNGDGNFDATKDKPIIDSVSNAPMMMVIAVSKDVIEPEVINP